MLAILLISMLLCQYASAIVRYVENTCVSQSEREIPVVKSVDVVVVGGTVPAVQAAISAANKNAEVFLVAPKLYLGEDICATLRLKRNTGQPFSTELVKNIFGHSNTATPLKVKAVLSKALQDAGVGFIYGSFVTDVIWDSEDNPAGVVIVNRAGRQAIIAKSIIDATKRASVCRLSGAKSQAWEKDSIEFQRVLVFKDKTTNKPHYSKHSIKIFTPDLHFNSFANAEQLARAKTYTKEQIRASESLFYIPPDPIICEGNSLEWSDATKKMSHFKPKGINNLFVLSGSAGIPRKVADSLLQPGAMAPIGAAIGKEAARLALHVPEQNELFLKPSSLDLDTPGDIKEVLKGLRPTGTNYSTVISPNTGIPVFGEYDIVVVGGGTSGAPAAIAASRMGEDVLVLEYQEGLGGIGTLGLIGKPYHGRKVGFAAEVPFPKENIEPKMEWYRRELEKNKADIWLGAIGCGAYVQGNMVKGVVVATPEGRGVVKANVVVDATGNGDIAIAAGADYRYGSIRRNKIALQGTGYPSRPLTDNYVNTDYLLVDETDMIDVWRTLVSVHQIKYEENNYDVGPMIQNRERRRVIGDFTMTYLDQIAGRTYPDAIVLSGSDYDSHGYPTSPYFALLPHNDVSKKQNHPAPKGTCFTPYRCLLPVGLEGILVTGLAISMKRDATAMVRMQLDIANQGYAAGLAAALAIENNISPRYIDVKALQKILINKGNLPDKVLEMEGSFPLPEKVIKKAITDYGIASNPETAGKPLAIILSHKKTALPLLKREYKKATGKQKLLYAQVLGINGYSEGVPELIAQLKKFNEWEEKILQGRMADYAHLPTPMDAVILALGYSGSHTVLPHLLEWIEKLDSSVTLSHHRSLALAVEKIGNPEAVSTVARMLEKPGMKSHAITNITHATYGLENNGKGNHRTTSTKKRTRALREIIWARALYTCGDYNGVGKEILENYANDLRGIFARHASHVLATNKPELQ